MKIGRALDMADLLDLPLPPDRTGQMAFYRTISNRAVDAIRALASAK